MYRFKYSGELAENARADRVKAKLAQAFKVDQKELNGLFNGEQDFVRENIEKVAAESYAALFERAGAIGEVSKMDASHSSNDSTDIDIPNHSEHVAAIANSKDSPVADQTKNSNQSQTDVVNSEPLDQESQNPDVDSGNEYKPKPLTNNQRNKPTRLDVNAARKASPASPWLRYGGVAVAATMIADKELQNALIVTKSGLDLGYFPLILAHIPLFIGCYLLAEQKRLSGFTKFLGIFSFAGLSILLLLPQKGARNYKLSLNALLVTLFSCGLFIYWFGGAVQNTVELDNYSNKFSEISDGRKQFPSLILQSDDAVYKNEQVEMKAAMSEAIGLINQGKLRPNQVSELANEMMHSLSGYIAWRHYQTYLHLNQSKTLPVSLNSESQKQDQKLFGGLLKSINRQSNQRLYETVTEWIIGPIDENAYARSHNMRTQLNRFFDAVRDAQIVQFSPSKGVPSDRLDLSKVDFPKVSGAELEIFENHVEYRFNTPQISNKSLVIGFYYEPTKKRWGQKKPSKRLVYKVINNEVPAKHIPQLVSVLSDYD